MGRFMNEVAKSAQCVSKLSLVIKSKVKRKWTLPLIFYMDPFFFFSGKAHY